MVGTEFINGQGLGNQLFCYVTARVVAEENGYEFGTAGQERFAVNIHSNRGMYFMDMDLGKRITEEEKRRFQIYNDKEERLMNSEAGIQRAAEGILNGLRRFFS